MSLGKDKVSGMISVDGAMSLAGTDSGEKVYWTADPTVELPIRVAREGDGSEPPVTVVDVLARTVSTVGDNVALRVQRSGHWAEWTWGEYSAECHRFAKASIAAGLQPHEVVTIIGFNSPEWLIADVGAILAGGIPAGIYTTNGAEACHYIADHSRASLAVVEDAEHLAKFLEIRDRLPHLRAIVMWTGELPPGTSGAVYSWKDFMAMGMKVPDAELEARKRAQAPGHCATLIYTSGTTGNPKAVMLSHDNVTWTAATAANKLFDITVEDHMVSYLPLSHIAAQMLDIHGPMSVGAQVSFARPDALQGSLVDTLTDVRPTMFLGVPRVWEKIEEKMRAVGAANSGIMKSIGDWAKVQGLAGNYAIINHESPPWTYYIASPIFTKIRKQLGLDRCKLQASGAAPITKQTLEYLMSVDVPVLDLYGMSESSGPQNVTTPGNVKIGSCGKAMPGTELVVHNPDKKGEGELIYRGRHIFMGYMHNREATQDTVDAQGFLHSGDVGKVDSDGFMFITGRIKELIITAGGENVPPVLIEDMLKEELPAVSNVMVIGDKRKFLSCLFTLRTEPDAEGKPTNQLAGPGVTAAKGAGSTAKTVEEAVADPKFTAMIQAGVERYNKRAVSNAQNVRKYIVLAQEFTVETGELTPTMKLKRKIVNTKYEAQIEGMYEEGPAAMKSSL